MSRFTQMRAVYDERALNLLQLAYNDFCRDARLSVTPRMRIRFGGASTPSEGPLDAQHRVKEARERQAVNSMLDIVQPAAH